MLKKKVCYDCIQQRAGITSVPWSKKDEGNWVGKVVFCPVDIDPLTEAPVAKTDEPAPIWCPYKADHDA